MAPSKASLWPPNHKLRTVTVSGATDPDGDPVAITITGVTQDEPVNGKADWKHVTGRRRSGRTRIR